MQQGRFNSVLQMYRNLARCAPMTRRMMAGVIHLSKGLSSVRFYALVYCRVAIDPLKPRVNERVVARVLHRSTSLPVY